MADRLSTLGTKLGPRLAQLMAQATIVTKQGLADTEHRLRVHSAQTVIDATGHEMADLMAPLIQPVLAAGVLPPDIHRVVETMASGRYQWQAIAGIAFGASGVPGALSTIVSNALAPTVRKAIAENPQLAPDYATLAQLAAHGLATVPDFRAEAAGQGIGGRYIDALVKAAESPPDVTTLLELLRRGAMDETQVREWFTRSGIPAEVHGDLLLLRFTPVSAADAALSVIRGDTPLAEGKAAAAQSGMDPGQFETIVANGRDGLPLDALLSLWRRGEITEDELQRGIRQARVDPLWDEAVRKLGVIPPTPDEALNALLQGQITEDEARRRYIEGGGDPTWFTDSFNANGSAPTPVEAADMANRGIIPWDGSGPGVTSFQQAFLEGPWRNKWLDAFRAAAEYLPPPRTVTALLSEGAIDVATAQDLLQRQGLSHELAVAYTTSGSNTKTADARKLAETQIVALYTDRAVDRAEASTMLVGINYTPDEAEFLLTLADLARVQRYLETAISTVHTQYTNHTVDRGTASSRLDDLLVPSAQRDDLLTLWDLERQTRVRVLTESQVVRAVKKELLTQDEGVTRLVQQGYPEDDARILLQL